jgi:hypothetical protein
LFAAVAAISTTSAQLVVLGYETGLVTPGQQAHLP